MIISKYISDNPTSFDIPKSYWIREEDYLRVVTEDLNYGLLSKEEYHKFYFVRKDNLFNVNLHRGVVQIFYGHIITHDLVAKLSNLADKLGAKLLINPARKYPQHKIIAAQKKLAQKRNVPLIEFQKESFGGNNMWLAIKSDVSRVMDFFKLSGIQTEWQDALDEMHACTGMFLFEFKGWVFLAGQLVDSLFAGKKANDEEAIEKSHVDKLLELGKTFPDVQLYMHYDRSTYFNAYYRVRNGEMVYGEYETESYQKSYGIMPQNIKELPDNNANTVAMEWSYDPDYLRYKKELKDAKAWILRM